MNLYEWEGKELLKKHGIAVPKSVLVRRGEDFAAAYRSLNIPSVVVKAQVLSGKRGKNNGVIFANTEQEVIDAVQKLFEKTILGQFVNAVLIEEKLEIKKEHYVSITYETLDASPVLILGWGKGGVDIEDVAAKDIMKISYDIRREYADSGLETHQLWNVFRQEDARLVEINPLVETPSGKFIAADAKFALDDDAFFRHKDWENYEARSMLGRLPTEREVAVQQIDAGEGYYRGTAGKYIEMDGNIAILFSGGGASIANMDALIKAGLSPANYTEYSGNPPREKVHALAKIVLSKPGLKGLWIAGGVANFTNIADTFAGIVDALDEIKPSYPIVIRRAGPFEKEGMRLMRKCAERNNLNIQIFGKETSMSETANILATQINKS